MRERTQEGEPGNGAFTRARTGKHWMIPGAVLLGLFLLAGGLFADTGSRGLQRIQLSDGSGQAVDLYKASYALLIGVSDYTAGWPDLESVPGELDRVEAALKAKGYTVIRHDDPDSGELSRAFESFIDRYGYQESNRLLIWFSGHGYTRKDGRKGYLVPADAPNPQRDEQAFLRSALGMNLILAWARQIEARHALFLFDSCFSGTVFKARALPVRPPHISRLTAMPVRQFITAGSAGEEVPANSVFTPAFVDALQHGLGDLDRDGYMTGTELGLYLQGTVPKHTRQTPQFGKITDYELARGDYVFQVARPAPMADPPIPAAVETAAVPQSNPTPESRPASLIVRSGLGGDTLYINDKPSGSTGSRAHSLAPGTYRLRVEKPGYEVWKARVTLAAGERRVEQVRIPKLAARPDPAVSAGTAAAVQAVAALEPQMTPVPGGCYAMGSPDAEPQRKRSERLHQVCVEPFRIGKFEVTFNEYDRFVRDKGLKEPRDGGWDRGNRPVIYVTWADAVAYAEWLSDKTGRRFRLPTEAEWEYAARAGTRTPFPTGSCIHTDQANYSGRTDYDQCGAKTEIVRGRTMPVGTFEPNPWGLHEMAGNVWEWTCSAWNQTYDDSELVCASGTDKRQRVMRGGSYREGPRSVRSAERGKSTITRRGTNIGFRLVEVPE